MRVAALVFAVLVAAANVAAARAASNCTLAKIDEWPLRPNRLGFVVDGEVNGRKAVFKVSTGLSRTVINPVAAARFGLDRSGPTGRDMNFPSRSATTRPVTVDELRIGAISGRKVTMALLGEEWWGEESDVALGMDILGRFELEFDVPGRMLRLFAAADCPGGSLAYWAQGRETIVPLDAGGRTDFTVQLEGRSLKASLTSNSVFSFVDRGVASGLGFREDAPGVAAAGCPPKKGEEYEGAWIAPFERLVVGDELIRHPRLRVADGWKYGRVARTGSRLASRPASLPELFLGLDFLKTHRVLVSPSQGRLYFTYAGGLVFPALPGQECGGLPDDGRTNPSIAELDAAVARDGGDAKALLSRGIVRSNAGQHGRAVEDFDEALRIDPRNAFLLAWRAHEFLRLREFDRAIADYDAALASGAQDASLHYNRARAWRAKGEMDKALADYTTAVEYEPRDPRWISARAAMWLAKGDPDKSRADYDAALAMDPGLASALHGRGLVEFSLGRFEEAGRDLAERMRVAPSPYGALWLHVARARGGKDGREELGRFAQSLAAGKWPEPIVRFHLGRLDRDGLLAAAANPEPRVQREQLCEANFHLGQHALMSGDPRAAQPWLAKAAGECPPNFEESQGAKAELKRLP